MAKTDTFRYFLLDRRGRVVYRGVTNDLRRREREHQARFPGATIHQVGRKITRPSALKWERNNPLKPRGWPRSRRLRI